MGSRRPRNRAPRQRAQPPAQPVSVALLVTPLVTLLLLGLWVIFWDVERINLAHLGLLEGQPHLPTILETLFRVLRHFIPLVLGWFLAYEVAVRLVQRLYNLPDLAAARKLLRRLRTSSAPLSETATLDPQTLAEAREKYVRLRVGGPGRVKLRGGYVAMTELNGRFYRILAAGTHSLARFEYVHSLLDLRPQERSAGDVTLTTLDGLELKSSVGVTYRISMGAEPVTRANPYPFDAEAVRKLAYTATVGDKGKVSNWEGKALGQVRGSLAKAVSQYRLDELLANHNVGLEPHLTLRTQVEEEARSALRKEGLELLRVRIGPLELPDAVTAQIIDYWRAYWETQAHITRLDGTADAIEEMEIARAEAELTMIQAIVEGVRRARREGRTTTLSQTVALRLIEALDKLARQSADAYPLPDHLLPRLHALQAQLDRGKEPHAPAAPPAGNSS